MSERYAKSEDFLKRAEKVIPLGCQTFSKSRTQYPVGVSPLYAKRAKGAWIEDVDGNRYLDLVNSLGAITLGYGDTDVNEAVIAQLADGAVLSLPHPLETEVAEMLVEMIPGAEKIRFGKNGSDVTSAAVRLARACTGRDHVLVCGYHGWQDWYIGTTARNLGIPEAVRNLSHVFSYNSIDSLAALLKQYQDNVAAVILEPMSTTYPQKGFLEEVKALTHKAGALLIFDEVVTGFRFAKGGCQELFGVEADLIACGKGMANGHAVSALAGKAKHMNRIEDMFFSGTFLGDPLSLSAAKATLKKMQTQDIVGKIGETGTRIMSLVRKLLDSKGLGDRISIQGHPAVSVLAFSDFELKTFFMQEMFSRNVLSIGSHILSAAMGPDDLALLAKVYEEVFSEIASCVRNGDLGSRLKVQPLKPLFTLRKDR